MYIPQARSVRLSMTDNLEAFGQKIPRANLVQKQSSSCNVHDDPLADTAQHFHSRPVLWYNQSMKGKSE